MSHRRRWYARVPWLWLLLVLSLFSSTIVCKGRGGPSKGLVSRPMAEGLPCEALQVAKINHELYGVWVPGEDGILAAGGAGIYRLRDRRTVEVAWEGRGVRFNSFRGNVRMGVSVGTDTLSGKMLAVRCDHTECAEMVIGLFGVLTAVWVGPNDEIVVAGMEQQGLGKGTLVAQRFDPEQGKWDAMPLPGKLNVKALQGDAVGDLWAVGTDWSQNKQVGVVAHFDGVTWRREKEHEGLRMLSLALLNEMRFCGGGYAVPDGDGRRGVLACRSVGVWTELELDKAFMIWSLISDGTRLVAGTTYVFEPSGDTVSEIVDLTNSAAPVRICCQSEPVEDLALLPSNEIVAVGRDGAIYILKNGAAQ